MKKLVKCKDSLLRRRAKPRRSQ